MSQSVWSVDDLGRVYSSALYLALEANADQSQEFLRGVSVGILAVAHAVGAPIRMSHQPRQVPDALVIDVPSRNLID